VRVLIVDDQEPVRRQLSRLLADKGYLTSEADSGAAALEQVREARPTLMLLDIGMPGMPGTDVIPEALDLEPDLGIVILSGAQDAPTVTTCLQRGALDYLTKPVELDRLLHALDHALRRRDTLAQERALTGWVKQEVRARTQELHEAYRRERELAVGALGALVAVLETKSPYLAGHSTRVAEFAASMATQLGLSDDEVERVRVAGQLHDIGMIGVREAVLDKQGPLSPEEYAHVREHAATGARILEPLSHLGEARRYVRGHHERWDGSGYPDGLAGEAIPVGARILHAAEVYDALTTARPYQQPLAPAAAVARMEELAGSVLDPAIVAALRAAVRRRQTLSFVATELESAEGQPPLEAETAPAPASATDVTELMRARDAAEAATRAKSVFLATVTHEMRTPMNGVLGMAEILLGTSLTAEQLEAVELIRTSATGLLTLINDVLDFSRIEAGRLELVDAEFDVGDTVRSVAALLAPRAAERGVRVTCRVEPEVPGLARGDPGRVRQVVTNLVGNAVKFTQHGEVAVSVARDGAAIALTVRDTGIGIPADKLATIFEQFQQVDAGSTRRYGGTGLGLAITKRLVEAMGGEIAASSRVGEGSEFRVRLPLAAVVREPAPPVAAAPLDGTRLLMVADDPDATASAVRHLERAAIRVDTTTGAAAAVERMRDAVAAGDPFAVVVVTLRFAGRSGFAVAETIRAETGLGQPPIVLAMPAGLRGDAQRCRALAIDAYLTDPVAPDDLVQAVAAVLGLRGTAGERPLITRHSLQPRRQSLRILLAEDVAINQKVARTLLTQRGHHVDVVADGRAALTALRSTPYDLVLMDLEMPEMDGLAATREIRRDPRLATLPIVALTAHALDADRAAALEAGMSGFLSKPFRPGELFKVVERFGSLAGPPDAPPVDLPGLRTMLADERMEGIMEELLVTFRAEGPRRLEAMRAALEAGDLAEVARAAHALKSSAGTIRAGRLATALQRVESAATDGQPETAGLVDAAAEEVTAAVQYLAGPGASP
jgi:response regulator RpfG family c-di-GMP phosphodiesterase/anti-sigma regulatory factor (Ser/Thr protein kinase)